MTTTATPPRAPAPPTRPSIAEQRQERSRRSRRTLRLVAALVVLVVLAVAAWVVYFSSLLATAAVTVSGAREVTPEQVTTAAAVPLGVPLARQDLDAIARRATTVPQVSAATVTREWPDRVRITVTERQPLLGIAQPGGYLVVDKTGLVFETRPVLPPGVVQVAADPTDRPLLVELGSVVASLPDAVRTQVTSIEAATPDSIRLKTVSGLTIVWGDSTQTELKAQVATALLQTGAKTSIDVSAPHSPAVR